MKDETLGDLKVATMDLFFADRAEKEAKTKKEKARAEFMALATKALVEDRPLRRQVVDIREDELIGETQEEQVENWRVKNAADWKVVKIGCESKREGIAFLVTLEEDPDYMKFTFVHPGLKRVFGRTTEERGAYFDSEGLREEVEVNVELSKLLGEAWTRKVVWEFNELYGQLVLSLHPELMPLFQKYSHPGKLSAKLTPIRSAKEEEVE